MFLNFPRDKGASSLRGLLVEAVSYCFWKATLDRLISLAPPLDRQQRTTALSASKLVEKADRV
jgi:hypothetical protein